ncbi:unnamed protein product [Closterium sp. Naga37s-1]|nr:unnamed protein product [Closterium sp. Naga37s-1]
MLCYARAVPALRQFESSHTANLESAACAAQHLLTTRPSFPLLTSSPFLFPTLSAPSFSQPYSSPPIAVRIPNPVIPLPSALLPSQPSTRAQTTESVASLEHSVYDNTGVFQVTFDTLEEEIREIRDQLNGNQKTGAKPAAPVPPVVQLAKLRVQVEELSSQHALLRGKLDSLVAAAGGVSAGAEGSPAAAAAAAAAVAAAEGSAAAGVNSTGGVAVQQAVGKLLDPLKARVKRDEERLKRVQERVDVVEKELADSTEVLQQLQVEVVTGGKVAPDPAAASVAAAEIPATTAALATPNVPAATVIPAPDEPAAVVIPEPKEPAAVVVPEATVPAAVVFPAPKEPGAGAVAVPEAGEPTAVVVPSPNEPAAVVIPEPADPAAVVVPGPSDTTPGPAAAAAAAAGAMGGTGGGKEGEAEGEEWEGEDDADLGPPEDYPGEGDVGEEGEEGGEEGGEEEGEEKEGGEGEAGTAEQVGKKSAGTAGETEAGGEEEAGEGEREVGEEGEEEGGEVGEDESPAVGGIDVAEVQQCGDEVRWRGWEDRGSNEVLDLPPEANEWKHLVLVLDLPPEANAWKQRSLVQITPDLQLFSAYRYNPHTIALVGLLSPAVPTAPLDACLFRQSDGSQPITGSLLRLQVESTSAVVLRFEGDTVLPPCGGYLECTAAAGAAGDAAAAAGAKVVVYTEGRGELSTPPSPLPTPLTICSLLITNGVSPPRLREWLDYHRVAAGAARFVLYRHSKSHWPTELRQAVGEYERMGMAEVTDIVGADKEQEKMLALQDCLYRTSLSSTWTLPLDLDEYLSASPPATLPSLLSASSPSSLAASPYLSLGAVRWSTEVCLGEADVVKVEREGIGGEGGEEDEADAAGDGGGRGNSSSTGAVFAVERAVFREPAPVCNADAAGEAAVGAAGGGGGEVDAALCEGDAGTRRVIVNPRKVPLAVPPLPPLRHTPKGGTPLNAKPTHRRKSTESTAFFTLPQVSQASSRRGGFSLHHPISSKGGATLNAHTQARVNRFLGLSSLKQAGRLCSSAVQQTGDAAAAAVDAAAAGAPRGSVESLEVAEGARLARECPIEKTREVSGTTLVGWGEEGKGLPRGGLESLEVADGARLARECPIEKTREVSGTTLVGWGEEGKGLPRGGLWRA